MRRIMLGLLGAAISSQCVSAAQPSLTERRFQIIAIYRCNIEKRADITLSRFKAKYGDASALSKLEQIAIDMHHCQDDVLGAAISAAADNQDLRNAVKNYHLKDAAFASSLTESQIVYERMDRELTQAHQALEMELKLAGMPSEI